MRQRQEGVSEEIKEIAWKAQIRLHKRYLKLLAAGKDKKKIILPKDVLEARTVLVVIDPDAGIAVDAPNANRTAQEDVEKALMSWGRFTLATDVSTADLIISVRRGNGKTAQPTIGGVPTNNRPVIFEPTDSGWVLTQA